MSADTNQAFDWEDLLDLIEDGELVPVLGKELLLIDTPDGQRYLEHVVVDKLVETFRLDRQSFPENCSLDGFATRYLASFPPQKRETSKRRIQKRVAEILAAETFDVPESLVKLANMGRFDLFITTTPYALMERALKQVGAHGCSVQSFSLHGDIQDIPDDLQRQSQPSVFNLFGALPSQANPYLDFAVTDEDMIEYLHRFNEQKLQFRELGAELKEKSLLLLGCGLPDGLLRFLIRSLSNDRLFPSKNYKVVDQWVAEDPNLLLFLKGFTNEIFLTENAVGFVAELERQWQDRGPSGFIPPPDYVDQAGAHPGGLAARSGDAPDSGGVFISYRRDDSPAVDRLVKALEDAGLPIWRDTQSIRGGDDWLREVKEHIKDCLLFLPIVSRHAQTDESEAMREWNLALERAERISKDATFIIPILIDDLEPGAAFIPNEFWAKDVIRCPQGQATLEFSQTIKAKFRERVLAKAQRL